MKTLPAVFAITTAYPESEREQLSTDINSILDPIAEEFDEGEATVSDDTRLASEAKPEDDTHGPRVAMFEEDKPKPGFDLTE